MNVYRHWPATLGWIALGIGLALQLFAPRLEITDGRFVIPSRLAVPGQSVDPQALVAKERRYKLASALLMLTGTVLLAFSYRHLLLPAVPPADRAAAKTTASHSSRTTAQPEQTN